MFDGVLRYIKCTLSYWNQRKEETYHCRCIKNEVEWGRPRVLSGSYFHVNCSHLHQRTLKRFDRHGNRAGTLSSKPLFSFFIFTSFIVTQRPGSMTSPSHGDDDHEPTILDKLDSSIPANLQKFDAFPKLTSTYKKRSESRGFLTIGVVLICVLLLLNDVGEFIWGWPDYEFGVDTATDSHMSVNVDMVVNMPCTCEFLCT